MTGCWGGNSQSVQNRAYRKTPCLVEEGTEPAQEAISKQDGRASRRANWTISTGDKTENIQIGSEEETVVCEELRTIPPTIRSAIVAILRASKEQ